MAMINCPECGSLISDNAAACPICGFPINPKKDAQNEESGVLMFRSEAARYVIAATVFLYIFWAIFGFGVYGCITLMKHEPEAESVAYMGMIFCGVLCIVCLFGAISSTVNIIKNKGLPKEMMTYDVENNKVTMTTLNGKKYTFSPSDFIDLSRNFLNDNIVKVRFYDHGKDRTVKLGWSLDPYKAERFIRDRKYKKN